MTPDRPKGTNKSGAASELYNPASFSRMGSVLLKDCVEELLKFTLASSIDGTLGIDLGLSKEYCSNLLQEDPSETTPVSAPNGVPPYPLYKHLASALHESITSGAFFGAENRMEWIHDDNSLKQRVDWMELVLNKGSELVNVLKHIGFELHVQEPFFSQIKDGQKTIEGRCASGNYNRIGPGDLIIVNKCVVLEVQDVHWYASFSEMLQAEGLTKVLPGVKTIEEGVQVYRKFYTEDKERSNGVLAIAVVKTAAQPCIFLASLLSGLGYGGVQCLLGLMRTAGTVPEGLPPPRSALFSSFTLPHKPNFIGFLEPYMEDGHSRGWRH
ncbi:uncharacterized protein LOC131150955 isoform X1 [Malania oleifera]|uniref:uncharacterized protein LOC131150955 isoform X1 n=1 Tax=Malania oleifera TaxID=397392 RepID=UPI0025AE44B3|nr:uncharacterized protein LOC131150955 isoform X1 [Malania oleifera]